MKTISQTGSVGGEILLNRNLLYQIASPSNFHFQMENITCPTLLEVTSEYGGSRDHSTEDLRIDGFCTVYCALKVSTITFIMAFKANYHSSLVRVYINLMLSETEACCLLWWQGAVLPR